MHILVAPNAFKHSISAYDAAEAIKEGLESSRLNCAISCLPVGDGGDGTGTLLTRLLKGHHIQVPVHDPLGRPIKATYGLVEESQMAIIELANASGLRLLQKEERDPLIASTYGTGELMKDAISKGVKKIVLCIGGSATVDGGIGILRAMGISFLDREGNKLEQLPKGLKSLYTIDDAAKDKKIDEVELFLLCDVENPLLGEEGAALVFGPQKGAGEKEVRLLESLMLHFSNITYAHTKKEIGNIKYGGAAGGTAAGLYAYLNARLVNGIEYFLELTGYDQLLNAADLVITGEGSIDEQTLQGKGPMGVAVKAKKKGIPVIALGGKVPLHNEPYHKYFDAIIPINHQLLVEEEAYQLTSQNLKRTAQMLGNLLSSVQHNL